MRDADPRINYYGKLGYDWQGGKYMVRKDLMREHNCNEGQASLIITLAFLNNYDYDLAINAVINEGATPILYNERHSGDGTYIYTRAYVTKTGKLIGKEQHNCEFSYPQNCYKHGGFK